MTCSSVTPNRPRPSTLCVPDRCNAKLGGIGHSSIQWPKSFYEVLFVNFESRCRGHFPGRKRDGIGDLVGMYLLTEAKGWFSLYGNDGAISLQEPQCHAWVR